MIVFTGTGKSGSWKIRGAQLGSAVGGDVVANASNLGHASLVVGIKRVPPLALAKIKAAGKPWVWDAVDSWPQPTGNAWTEKQAVEWLKGEIKRLQPNAIVFATSRMREDSGWRGDSIVVPHHSWSKYSRRVPNGRAVTVSYEGGHNYLGMWRKRLEMQCRRRGWSFSYNQGLDLADIGVALREQDGYAARTWKSNVKLANCQAVGIPAICSPEEAYKEFGTGAELFVESVQDLETAFAHLADPAERARIGERMYVGRLQLANIATRYRAWLNGLNF